MEDVDFLDLVVSAHQISDTRSPISKPRFRPSRPLGLVYDSADESAWSNLVPGIERNCSERHRAIQKLDTALLDSSPVPMALAIRKNLLADVGGLIICLGKRSGKAQGILLNALNSESAPPILLLADEMRPTPLDAARQNVISVSVSANSELQIEAVVRGFLSDNWTDAVSAARIEQSIAARHGTPEIRRRDAKQIVKAVAAPLLGLPTSPAGLKNLPFLPEFAADEVVKRLDASGPPIFLEHLLAKLGCELCKVPIEGVGYLIPAGVVKQGSMIAVRSNDPAARRRFTIAHELGDLALLANPGILEQREDEEIWCEKICSGASDAEGERAFVRKRGSSNFRLVGISRKIPSFFPCRRRTLV